ncbi:cell division protein FtsQ [Streptomyces sp. B3I7]|uniref:cell division protein FtsQ/DivIB n=1 Tax=Streptomyces sp. B3I7 TaxID=3042269 RepID=UPI00277D7325|nr:FtsQ-type POTRA domain-containing protein [Streptomyces sp. B3I7]MDQ0813954.1 cell division protein FtsQ [Streptomyces sp. B3I7]
MAGPTTAERGERHQPKKSGPPRPPLRRRLPRRRTLVLLAPVVLVLGTGLLWLLYGSPWLRAERVSVSGTRVLTPEQVRTTARVPLGDALLSVDTDAIEARLRAELPRIDTVDVSRAWPHGITLKVTERVPVLVIGNTGATGATGATGTTGTTEKGDGESGKDDKARKYVEVDKKGVRFATVSRVPRGTPRLELTVARGASARRFGTARLTRAAVDVAGDLPAEVARATRTVKVRSYDSVTLELGGGRTVLWGSAEQGRVKARTLTALMKAAPRARHFDVSVPTAPASSAS